MTTGRRVVGAVLVMTVVIGAIAERRRLLIAIGQHLVTSDAVRPADAIAVLLGSFPDRVLEAADLYSTGYAPLVLLTSSPPPPGFDELRRRGFSAPEPHELNREVLIQAHVPPRAIVVLDPAVSTSGEAHRIASFLVARRAHSVILVTSAYHTTRAAGLLREASGGALDVIARPARLDTFQASNWWTDRTESTYVALEYAKSAYHLVEWPFTR